MKIVIDVEMLTVGVAIAALHRTAREWRELSVDQGITLEKRVKCRRYADECLKMVNALLAPAPEEKGSDS